MLEPLSEEFDPARRFLIFWGALKLLATGRCAFGAGGFELRGALQPSKYGAFLALEKAAFFYWSHRKSRWSGSFIRR